LEERSTGDVWVEEEGVATIELSDVVRWGTFSEVDDEKEEAEGEEEKEGKEEAEEE